MRALVLLSALSLIGCAHQQVRDDRPLDGAGGGVGLDAPAVATRVMLAGGMGVGGLKSINGGPNEHASQNMTATSITLSAASGANGWALSTNGARGDFGTGASDYIASDGTNLSTPTAWTAGSLNTSGGVTGASLIPTTNALPTCSSGLSGYLRQDNTGATAAVKTKVCVCTWTPTGSVAKWFNILNPSDTTGTTTTCPN